jgi:hypothetical protein
MPRPIRQYDPIWQGTVYSFPHHVLGRADPGSDFVDAGQDANAPLRMRRQSCPVRRAKVTGGLTLWQVWLSS